MLRGSIIKGLPERKSQCLALGLIAAGLKLATWAGRKLKYSATFGDGSATQYDLTHNLNTLDVQVQVYRVSDGATVIADMTRLNANTVRINTAAAVASNALRAVILG